MRQPTYYTNRNRLLIFLITSSLFFCFQSAGAQKPTVIIKKAIAIKTELILNLEIKRFRSQKLTLELKHMESKLIQRFAIDKAIVIQKDDSCTINLRIKFPPGDIQILLYDENNLPICNPRRQNTEENAKNYDPSKGNN